VLESPSSEPPPPAFPAVEGENVAPERREGGRTAALAVFKESKLAVVGVGVIVFIVLFCFVGPLIYRTNQTNAQTALLQNPLQAHPSGSHLLGTDPTGFDELGRLMVGGRNSLIIGFAAAGIATLLGLTWGTIAGYLGGWVDSVMMRVVDTLLSIPTLLLLIVLAVIFTPSLSLLIVVIGSVAWLVPSRLVRGEALTLRTREFVQAVRMMGGTGKRIVFRHIVPNAIGTIIVNLTFQIADAILFLAALGYLGLGIPPPATDWGSMLSNGVNYSSVGDWWLIYPAGVAIVLVVVAFNYVGDALRDALDVRLQKR
jgi:peptide/nickel transport system permease protein